MSKSGQNQASDGINGVKISIKSSAIAHKKILVGQKVIKLLYKKIDGFLLSNTYRDQQKNTHNDESEGIVSNFHGNSAKYVSSPNKTDLSLTYGEIVPSSFSSILNLIQSMAGPSLCSDTLEFVDLGSGCGKAVFSAALLTMSNVDSSKSMFTKCMGIELIPSLTEVANRTLNIFIEVLKRIENEHQHNSNENIKIEQCDTSKAKKNAIHALSREEFIESIATILMSTVNNNFEISGNTNIDIDFFRDTSNSNHNLGKSEYQNHSVALNYATIATSSPESSLSQQSVNMKFISQHEMTLEILTNKLVNVHGHKVYKETLKHLGISKFSKFLASISSIQSVGESHEIVDSAILIMMMTKDGYMTKFHRSISNININDSICHYFTFRLSSDKLNLILYCYDSHTQDINNTSETVNTFHKQNDNDDSSNHNPHENIIINNNNNNSNNNSTATSVNNSQTTEDDLKSELQQLLLTSTSTSRSNSQHGKSSTVFTKTTDLPEIVFQTGDIFHSTCAMPWWKTAGVVYMASLLFTDEMMLHINLLIRCMKPHSWVVSLKPFHELITEEEFLNTVTVNTINSHDNNSSNNLPTNNNDIFIKDDYDCNTLYSVNTESNKILSDSSTSPWTSHIKETNCGTRAFVAKTYIKTLFHQLSLEDQLKLRSSQLILRHESFFKMSWQMAKVYIYQITKKITT